MALPRALRDATPPRAIACGRARTWAAGAGIASVDAGRTSTDQLWIAVHMQDGGLETARWVKSTKPVWTYKGPPAYY